MSILSVALLVFIVFGARQVEVALSDVTIRSEEEGYFIECIDIYYQPAFKNPLLKSHKIKRSNRRSHSSSSSSKNIQQTWLKSGSCPEGTIPIVKCQENIKKSKNNIWGSYHPEGSGLNDDNPGIEEETTGIATPNADQFSGIMADIHIWQPKVELEESSLAYIAISGEGQGGNKYSVIAGWIFNPSYYGDGRPRIIVMRTGTNAFNLDSGFIQTSKKVSVDAPLAPISVNWTLSYAVHYKINKDEHFNWRIFIGDEELGYYPAALLPDFNQGNINKFGGKVFNRNIGGKHTTTEMGNGFRPTDDDIEHSAQITGIYSFNLDGGEEFVTELDDIIITNRNCYNFVPIGNVSLHNNFVVAFGGSCK